MEESPRQESVNIANSPNNTERRNPNEFQTIDHKKGLNNANTKIIDEDEQENIKEDYAAEEDQKGLLDNS